MSRPKLIKLLKNKHPKLNKPQLERIIDAFFESIIEALKEKKTVELRGFGTFFITFIQLKLAILNAFSRCN